MVLMGGMPRRAPDTYETRGSARAQENIREAWLGCGEASVESGETTRVQKPEKQRGGHVVKGATLSGHVGTTRRRCHRSREKVFETWELSQSVGALEEPG